MVSKGTLHVSEMFRVVSMPILIESSFQKQHGDFEFATSERGMFWTISTFFVMECEEFATFANGTASLMQK